MAMLADEKKKKRWSINPRGTLWTNDENKFGQKLLEKMGWSKGKGLGKEEQGCKEPIRLSMNEEQRGVGYKGKSDLEWTKHYDAFEDILSNLNSVNSTVNDTAYEDNESVKGVVESLEKKSKVSKSRVHYHKFTRGKDLSRYNDDELACVLGSKRLKPNITESEVDQPIATPLTETGIGQTGKSHGLTTVHGGNLKEYFSQKMTELKRKRGEGIIGYTGNTDQNIEEINDVSFPNLEFEPEKLSFSFNVSQSISEAGEKDKKHCSTKMKKSKRKGKANIEEAMEPDDSTIPINSKIEKKDKKNRKQFNDEILIEETDDTKKKSPKGNSKLEKFSEEEYHPKMSKKKEKKLKKAKENEYSIEDIDTNKCKNHLKSELKVSTHKINDDCSPIIATENLGDKIVTLIKKKKNKKQKSKENISKLDCSLKGDCFGDEDKHDEEDVLNQSKELNESYGIAMSVTNEKKRKHREENRETGAPLKKIKKLTSELNLGELFKSSSSLIPCDEASQGKSLPGKKIKLSAKKSFKELKSGVGAKLKRIKEIYNEHELQEKVTEDNHVNISNKIVSEKKPTESIESNKYEKDMTTIHNLKGKSTLSIPREFVVNMNDLFPGSNLAEIKGYD